MYVRAESESKNDAQVNEREGRIPCPQCKVLFTDQVVASHCTEEVTAIYMTTRFRIQKARALQDAQELKQKEGDLSLFAEQLRTQMPNARQCPSCEYGPIDHCACDNLRTHHGKGGVNNSCPRCRHFEENIEAWPVWNGKVHALQGQVIDIFVVTPNAKTIKVQVQLLDTVAELKKKIQDKEGIPPNQQVLIYIGKPLRDHDTMFDHNIQKNVTINMIMRLRGGTKSVGVTVAFLVERCLEW
jgi:ubiquitin